MAYPGIPINFLPGRLAALFRVPIDYVLEVRAAGGLLAAVSLPNNPTSISAQRPGSVAITHTLDGVVREPNESKFATIQISGSSGYKARAGYNEDAEVIFAPGPIILREFDLFLRKYQKSARDAGTSLIFRAFDESVDLAVEVEAWTWSRAAGASPFMYEWNLVLRSYATAEQARPVSLISPLDETINGVTDAINLANAAIALAANAATNARGDLDVLRGPLQALQRTGLALDAAVVGARDLLAFPRDLVSDFASAADSFRTVWDSTRELIADPVGIDGIRGDLARLDRIFGSASEDSARAGLEALGGSGGGGADLAQAEARAAVAVGRPRATPPPRDRRRQVAAVVPVRLRDREGLRDVAARVYGDADRWIEIASYNGWQDAHRLGSGRLARVGDVVLVPTGERVTEPRPSPDPYLRDLFLDGTTGDLAWLGGDLRTITGPDNLEQAIRNRIRCQQGESSHFQRYGIPRFVGDPMGPASRGYLAAHLRDQLLRDPRIGAVRALAVVDGGDTLDAEAEVVPSTPDGAPVSLRVPLA